jgi:Bax protein
MKKVISYRQKVIELARIYKIERILDPNLKLTTYEIELELLKNKVPIPSRRGYFSHKIINEIINPLYVRLKKSLSINHNFNKTLQNSFNYIKRFLPNKVAINFTFRKILKNISEGINNYFSFVTFNISNFFKVLTKTIINSLNNVYHFKFEEKSINKFILRGVYSFAVVMLVSSGFYIKNLITNVDGLRISVEIKSDKKENTKKVEEKNIVRNPEVVKKNLSKDLKKKSEVSKKPYDPESDYTLNTQTVLNLFEDLEYNLDHVRNKKKVKPIYFTRLPKDLNTIKSVKDKKETFLQILLPLVVAENEKIKKDREYLLKILKENNSVENKKWLNKKYKAYKVSDRNVFELIEKIDIIPTSIALAQAAKESGWGTSRFALEGNAIYGQWTWSGDGIEPLEKNKDQNHKILKFPLLRASVKAYINNLNTHNGYKNFRLKRAEIRKKNKKLEGLELIHELKNYAQTGEEYTKILEKIIEQNDLDELESVTIDDFKKSDQLKL